MMATQPAGRVLSPTLHSKEVRKDHQRDSQGNEKNRIANEVRKYHQREAANQWHHPLLFFAINEKPQAYRAKQQCPKQR
jgi:hypothetical protein